jgi:membrane-associated protease RseP (regulator of RpoE activity)
MSFVAIDLILFAFFTLITVLFLYKHKTKISREGIFYLYRTQIGVKIIEKVSKRYSKLIGAFQYISIVSGFVLMVSMVWFIVKLAITYITSPTMAQALKVPIIMPLFPYLPSLFKMDFLPPFYFTYWIIIIAIVAIPHEFFHGIFARFSKVKVHSTGFGFLGPLILFFVEPNEKQLNKLPNKDYMAMLAAGTFANLLTATSALLVFWLFFLAAFSPAGVSFNTYALTQINGSQITGISNASFGNITYLELSTNNGSYFTSMSLLPVLANSSAISQDTKVAVYENSPAFNNQLGGAITSIDNIPIRSYNDLNKTLSSMIPGTTINIQTISENNIKDYTITLADKNGRAFLGIGIIPPQTRGISGAIYKIISAVKSHEVYYKPRFGELCIFVNDLLWWLVLITLSLALMNMLPIGIFDGGKFFYLFILSITKKKKIATWAYKISTWFFLLLLLVMMIKWVLAVF